MDYLNYSAEKTTLGTILRCFNSPVNEEQAWALCYQIVKYVIQQISTSVDINSDCQLNAIKTLDEIILVKDGSVRVPSVFSSTILSGPSDTFYKLPNDQSTDSRNNVHSSSIIKDTSKDHLNNLQFGGKVNHKKFIVSLGLILFQALDYGLAEDEERTLEPSLEILIERLTSADSEMSAVTSTTATVTGKSKCSKTAKVHSNNNFQAPLSSGQRNYDDSDDSDTEVPNDMDDEDDDATSCDEGIEEDSGGSSQPSSLKPEAFSQHDQQEQQQQQQQNQQNQQQQAPLVPNEHLSSSSTLPSSNVATINQIHASSLVESSSNQMMDTCNIQCSNLQGTTPTFSVFPGSGLNLNVILEMCKCHLMTPNCESTTTTTTSAINTTSCNSSSSSTTPQLISSSSQLQVNETNTSMSPDSHYKAVCRALFIEANELTAFLRQIALGSAALAKSDSGTSTCSTSNIATIDAATFEDGTYSLVEVNNLAQADWARLWMQVIRELRNGVKLKTITFECDNGNRRAEYELTPYEMLLQDIRAKRYKLKHVGQNETNVHANGMKKDAHELILEFIRSRPPLVPVSKRNLPPLPPKQQTIYEKLMASIRSQPVKLRPVPMPRTSRQGSLRVGRVCEPNDKIDHTVETSRTKFIDEEITPAPRRRLIKADFHLHLSSSFDDEDDGAGDGDQSNHEEEAIDGGYVDENERKTPTQVNDSTGRNVNLTNDSKFGQLNDECKYDDDSLSEDSSSTDDDAFEDCKQQVQQQPHHQQQVKQQAAIKIRRKKRTSSNSNGNSVGVRGGTTKASVSSSSMTPSVTTNINVNSNKVDKSVTSRFGPPQVESIDAKFGKKFNLKSFTRFFTFDSDHSKHQPNSASNSNRLNSSSSSSDRRHSITVCETPQVKSSHSNSNFKLPRPNRLSLLLHLNNNHISPNDLIVDPNEDTRDRIASIWSATNWGKAYNCLSLTLEEVQHIRSVLTRAELESLSVTRALKEDLEKGRICFTCLKTRFGSFFGPFATTCKLCQRSICSKCTTIMSVPSDCLAKVPIYMLSPTPTPSPPNEFDSLVSAFSGRSDDEHTATASGTDGGTTTDEEIHTNFKHFGQRQLRRLHNNNNNNNRVKSSNKCRRSSSNVSSNSVQLTKAKLMRALTIGTGGGSSSKPIVSRDESTSTTKVDSLGANVTRATTTMPTTTTMMMTGGTSCSTTASTSSKVTRVTTVMKLCRDCKLLVRHIIDVGHTNYDSTMATTSRQWKKNSAI